MITLPGPAGNFNQIKTPAMITGLVTPAIEARLNDRQKRIITKVMGDGLVTRGWCVRD